MAIVNGDPSRLRQVVDNLLINVRRHTPPGVACTIRIGCDGDQAMIIVVDEGPGMWADDADRAFDRFHRADASRTRSSGGAGLGLSIVAAIVEAHGGTVAMSSTLGIGTTVTVRLPLAKGAPVNDLMWVLSRSTGIVAAVLAVAALAWGFLFSARELVGGIRRLVARPPQLAGRFALIFTLAHIVTSYVNHDSGLSLASLFVPRVASSQALAVAWGVIGTYLFATTVLTSWPQRVFPVDLANHPPGSVLGVRLAFVHTYEMGTEASGRAFRIGMLLLVAIGMWYVVSACDRVVAKRRREIHRLHTAQSQITPIPARLNGDMGASSPTRPAGDRDHAVERAARLAALADRRRGRVLPPTPARPATFDPPNGHDVLQARLTALADGAVRPPPGVDWSGRRRIACSGVRSAATPRAAHEATALGLSLATTGALASLSSCSATARRVARRRRRASSPERRARRHFPRPCLPQKPPTHQPAPSMRRRPLSPQPTPLCKAGCFTTSGVMSRCKPGSPQTARSSTSPPSKHRIEMARACGSTIGPCRSSSPRCWRPERPGRHRVGRHVHQQRYRRSLQSAIDLAKSAGLTASPDDRHHAPDSTDSYHVEHVMGTAIVFDVRDSAPADARLAEAVAWLHHVDRTFSTYIDDSPISRLGRAEITLDDVEDDVTDVLQLCERLREDTEGAFDVFAVPAPNGSSLDPSGLVKGWSIDRAAADPRHTRPTDFSINAGGDIALRGRAKPETPWTVGIRHPHDRDKLAIVLEAIGPAAIATSATYERGAHIVDGRTRRPVTELASVTVVGADLTLVDAYATVVFVMGIPGLDWLARHDGFEAMLITHDLQMISTSGFRSWCRPSHEAP